LIARLNAELIRSVPERIAQQITNQAQRMVEEGRRPEEIQRELKVIAPRHTKAHARLIARTEIGKAETELTRVRAENIGIEWTVWQTSDDQRVRPSHKNLNGVILRFDDPPDPDRLIGKRSTLGAALPGAQPNCRCVSLPLIDLDEVRFPARVFMNNNIVRMTRSQFASFAGYQRAA
jgi:SPP1 gp7 family putative phage head morphogenesis protein